MLDTLNEFKLGNNLACEKKKEKGVRMGMEGSLGFPYSFVVVVSLVVFGDEI